MYVVIISQYQGSCLAYITKYDESNFPCRAHNFVADLEEYKRREHGKPINYGDLKTFNCDRRRFNINDDGDIYFFLVATVNAGVRVVQSITIEVADFWPDKASRESIRISEHHSQKVVDEIAKKHFILI